MKYKKQKGLIAAVHTPLNNDLSINYNYIEKQAKHLLKHNISGVYVGGTTGEGLLFSNKERSELFKAWGEITKYNRLIFFANISHKNQSSSSKLAIEAQNSGADFISSLCLDPNVNSPKDLVKWLKPILNTTPDIPYYYYESPKFSGKKINMEDFLIITNKELKSLVGLKYNNSNLEMLKRCINLNNRKYDILFGVDEMLISGLELGCRGAIGSSYNFAGLIYNEIIKNFNADKKNIAKNLQEFSIKFIKILSKHNYLPSSKIIMNEIGINCGSCRDKNNHLENEQIKSLYNELNEINFFKKIKI